MRKILFPTDYSNAADNAFKYTLQIANKTKAEIVTLHVFQKPDVGRAKYSSTMRDIYLHNEMEEVEKSQEDAKHLRQIAQAEKMDHILMNHILEEGEVISTILEVADREEVDIIIMGSNGKTGVTETIYGSNAVGVVKNANIFVLTIPEQAKFDGQLDKIAVATSFADIEKKAMDQFLKLASKYNLKVICVHVAGDDKEEDARLLEDWKKEFGSRISKFDIIPSIDIVDGLHNYVKHNNVDMVAMLRKKRNFFQRIFSPSLTKQMVYFQKLPVLALREDALKD